MVNDFTPCWLAELLIRNGILVAQSGEAEQQVQILRRGPHGTGNQQSRRRSGEAE
jgi:hypothetical protein